MKMNCPVQDCKWECSYNSPMGDVEAVLREELVVHLGDHFDVIGEMRTRISAALKACDIADTGFITDDVGRRILTGEVILARHVRSLLTGSPS